LESIVYLDRGNKKIHNKSELEEKLISQAMGGELEKTKTVLSREIDVLKVLRLRRLRKESESELVASDGGSQGDITLPALLSLHTLRYKKRFLHKL